MLMQHMAFPERDADRIFREAMKADGVGFVWRFWVWAYVRVRKSRVPWEQQHLTAVRGPDNKPVTFTEFGIPNL